VALDWCAAEKQVDLVIAVAVPSEILDHSQAALAICNRCIVVVLLAVLINREAFEVEHSTWSKLGLDWTGYKDWRFTTDHTQLCLTTLDDLEVNGNNTCYFNSSTERDLT